MNTSQTIELGTTTINFIKNNFSYSYFPLAISFLALIVSLLSYLISRKQLFISSRPYIVVENHGYLGSNNIIVSEVNTVRIMALNVPAKIVCEKYNYSIYEGDVLISNLDDITDNDSVLYPTDKIQSTRSTQLDIKSYSSKITANQEIRRLVEINYKSLLNPKIYFLKAVWKFDLSDNSWKTLLVEGN